MFYYPYVVYKVAWAQQVLSEHILKQVEIPQHDIEEFHDAVRHKGSLSMEIYMKDCKNISTREDPKFVVTERFMRIFNRDFLKFLRGYLDARHIAINRRIWRQTVSLLTQYTKDQFIQFTPGRLTRANIIKIRRES